MRADDLRSLIWLSRWYNGRAERLDEIHEGHLGNLFKLILEEVDETPDDDFSISINGFVICLSSSMEILSITPPKLFQGEQLELFLDDEQYADCVQSA